MSITGDSAKTSAKMPCSLRQAPISFFLESIKFSSCMYPQQPCDCILKIVIVGEGRNIDWPLNREPCLFSSAPSSPRQTDTLMPPLHRFFCQCQAPPFPHSRTKPRDTSDLQYMNFKKKSPTWNQIALTILLRTNSGRTQRALKTEVNINSNQDQILPWREGSPSAIRIWLPTAQKQSNKATESHQHNTYQ